MKILRMVMLMFRIPHGMAWRWAMERAVAWMVFNFRYLFRSRMGQDGTMRFRVLLLSMRCIAAASSDVYDNVISMAYRALPIEILGSLYAVNLVS